MVSVRLNYSFLFLTQNKTAERARNQGKKTGFVKGKHSLRRVMNTCHEGMVTLIYDDEGDTPRRGVAGLFF
jgi:hypothetical protein